MDCRKVLISFPANEHFLKPSIVQKNIKIATKTRRGERFFDFYGETAYNITVKSISLFIDIFADIC